MLITCREGHLMTMLPSTNMHLILTLILEMMGLMTHLRYLRMDQPYQIVTKLFVDSYYRSQKKQNYWHFVIKDMAMLFKNLGLWLNWQRVKQSDSFGLKSCLFVLSQLAVNIFEWIELYILVMFHFLSLWLFECGYLIKYHVIMINKTNLVVFYCKETDITYILSHETEIVKKKHYVRNQKEFGPRNCFGPKNLNKKYFESKSTLGSRTFWT